MNWYKLSQQPSKFVYHVSPDSNIHQFTPTGSHAGLQAKLQGDAGIYVAPDFPSAVRWAISYVAHKKGDHTLKQKEKDEYYKNKDGTMPRIKKRNDQRYSEITIYKISVSPQLYQTLYQEAVDKKLGFWEPEFFVNSKNISQLQIVSKQTIPFNDLIAMDDRWNSKKMEATDNRNHNIVMKQNNPNIQLWTTLRNQLMNLMEQYRRVNKNKEIMKIVGYLNTTLKNIYQISIEWPGVAKNFNEQNNQRLQRLNKSFNEDFKKLQLMLQTESLL